MRSAVFLCLLANVAFAEDGKLIFERAAQALAAGDYRAAEEGFEAVLKREPNNIGAIANLGIVYSRTSRADLAIVADKRALRLSPNDPAILLNLGLVYFRQERQQAAMPYFERVVALNPQNQQARQLLAVCRLYSGHAEQAVQDLQALRAQSPRDEQLLFLLGFACLRKSDSAAAKEVFDQMFEIAGPVKAQFLLGRASYEAALFPQAEESFLAVQKEQPDFPGLHLELGKLYISERRTDDAIRELKAALAENSTNEDADYFLGGLLVQESRFAEAVPYLEDARRLKPDSWATYFYLGKAKLRLRNTAEAVTLLERAVALNDDDGAAQYQLARALEANGQKAAAERAFRRARELKAEALKDVKLVGIR